MANIKIAIINNFTGLTDQQVLDAVKDLQTQVHNHFAPVWGIDADLTYYPQTQMPPADAWQLVIFDNSDQAGAAGYHDLTQNGLPLAKVFAGTGLHYNIPWTVTASHEILEMLADPDINLCILTQNEYNSARLIACEVCDPCEDKDDGYLIGNTKVSDFVYPAYFETFHTANNGIQYDYMKKITAALTLIPGGYMSYNDISSGNGWSQISNDDKPSTYESRAKLGSRRERRRTPRNQWVRSTKQGNF